MARRKRKLVKISGTVLGDPTKEEALSEQLRSSKKGHNLWVLCGGGKAITAALRKARVRFKFIDGQRVIRGERGKRIAAQILNDNVKALAGLLREQRIEAVVFPPIIQIGDVYCHLNGDTFVEIIRREFKKVVIITWEGNDKSDLLSRLTGVETEIIYL